MESKITLDPPRTIEQQLELAATLEQGATRRRLWYRVPLQWRDAITPNADPFLLGFLLPIMQLQAPVHIEGPVSPSLLQNFDRFMHLWHAWFPHRYHTVSISASQERELPSPQSPDECIIPFSGGVDSAFTAFRHQRQLIGRRSRRIGAALTLLGFDIPQNYPNAPRIYESMLTGAGRMLASLQIPCIPVATNFRELRTQWEHSHLTALAGALSLFAPRFGGALIPNSTQYANLGVPWGSHPLSDSYLGSAGFPLLDDGAECNRIAKIELLQQWPEALSDIRVCHDNPKNFANCCACEKCILTMLGFRVAALPQPPSFTEPLSNDKIARMQIKGAGFHESWSDLARHIQSRGLDGEPWARALRTVRRRHALRQSIRRLNARFIPLRDRIRTLTRGSALSRSQLADLQVAQS